MASILFIDQFSQWGGGQRVAFDVLGGLIAGGHHVSALLPGKGDFALAVRSLQVEVGELALPRMTAGRKNLLDLAKMATVLPKCTEQIAAAMDVANADTLYINGARALIPAARAAKGRRAVFHAHLIYGRTAAIRIAHAVDKFDQPTVICPSEAVAEPLRPFAQQARFLIAPNWVRDEFMVPVVTRPSDPRPLVVGIAGRISANKGQHIIVEALGLQLGLGDFEIHIAGDAGFEDPAYEKKLKASSQGVRFLGAIDDMAAFYDSIDILAVPSESEAFGLVAVEAMARGRPVVATNVGGLSEVVDSRSGILVERTPRAFRDAILSLDREARARMGQAGRERVEERYNKAANLDSILTTF